MKKIKSVITPINILNNHYDDTNLNTMDFVVLDNELSILDEIDIDAEEFNYHLKAIIAKHKNLINPNDSKSTLISNLNLTIH